MTNEEIQTIAGRNEPIPNGATVSEQLAITKIKLLLAKFKSGEISPEVATEQKHQILHDLQANTIREENGKRALKWIAQFYLNLYMAETAFRKNPSIDTARRLMDQIDGFEKFDEVPHE